MGWGLHTLVLGTLHCWGLLGLGQESAHQTQSRHGSRSPPSLGDIWKCFLFSDGFLLHCTPFYFLHG